MANIKYDFTGKGVVVTGGAQGIGFQMARDFLAASAKVSIWDYSQDALAKAKQELSQFEGRVTFAQTDVTKPESCQAAAGALPFALDVLINNAGITRDKSLTKMSHEDWDAVIDTNLTGLFNVTKACLEKFNGQSQNRRIINISSVVALYGNFGQTNYAAAKAGVIGMTKTWARELSRKGFTVNAIAPGFITTAMTSKMPPEALKAMVDKIPAGRMGQTSDIANAALYLASDEASYVSGTVISVDGALVP